MRHSLRASRRGGFTLIELLAVIVIIAILFAFIVPNLFSSGEAVRTQSARTFLNQLSTEISSYETATGDYPRSTFPRELDPKPSPANMGAEMLVISLLPADGSYRASSSLDDRLCNTDGDDSKTSHTRFTNSEAFELRDPWENPIAYLHRRDYERGCVYVTFSPETGDWVEEKVTAMINSRTGDPYRPDTFQLLSAGPDGLFGTVDDIGNFSTN